MSDPTTDSRACTTGGFFSDGRSPPVACRHTTRHGPRRIGEVAARRLVEKFPGSVSTTADGSTLLLELDDRTWSDCVRPGSDGHERDGHGRADDASEPTTDDRTEVDEPGGSPGGDDAGALSISLSRSEAAALREALGEALAERRSYLHTAGEHRADGSYAVTRRGADSSGHTKVFGGFDELGRLYDRLPTTFTADDVGRTGLTGGRRHLVVRHLCEHPAFDCSLASRQPLTGRKADDSRTGETRRDREGGEVGSAAAGRGSAADG